jgi:hypothetical protein
MDVVFWNGGIVWDMLARYIGPYKISHWIKKSGYSSQVIDFVDDLSEEQLLAASFKFITNKTKVVAISMTFISNNEYKWNSGASARIPEHCFKVLKQIKQKYPNIKFIVGGYMSDRVSGWGIIDATIMSYTTASEDIFVEYLDHLTKGTQKPMGQLIMPSFGKNYMITKHRMHYNQAREPKYNIETDDFKFTKQDVILPGEPLPLDVSRGCIFACKFCQYPHLGKKKLDYIRGMSYLEDELNYNYETFGTTKYYILDDTFNDTETKMQEFYDMTQRLTFNITFSAYLRADLIHRFPNTAYLLQESGLYGAYHGIETLHPAASNLVGKAWSGKHAKTWIPELYHNIWKNKVPMHTNFIVGITGDTEQNVRDTVTWYRDNQLHSIQFNALGLYGPNNGTSNYTLQSEFDKNAGKYGYTFKAEEGEQYRPWKNDNWTTESAVRLVKELTKMVKPYKRVNTWPVQSLLWYGFTKQELDNTPHVDLDWQMVKDKSKIFLNLYFTNLMAI